LFRKQNGPQRRHGRRAAVTGTRGARLRSRLSYANVTASLALFVALGGTAAAAVTLPRDSVGSPQIRKDGVKSPEIAKDAVRSPEIAKDAVGSPEIKAEAVGTSKIHDGGVRLADISAGARGALQGAQGPAGPRGDTGPQGPAGPTAAAVSNTGDAFPGPDDTLSADASLITPSAGDVLAFGQVTVEVSCPADSTFNCAFDAGLYVDGDPVPASGFRATIQKGASESYDLDLFGLAPDVPAGTHEVTIGWSAIQAPSPPEVTPLEASTRLGALLVGG
jgi:hypothetical protein